MSIVLPELPWAKDSLAPHISAEVRVCQGACPYAPYAQLPFDSITVSM